MSYGCSLRLRTVSDIAKLHLGVIQAQTCAVHLPAGPNPG